MFETMLSVGALRDPPRLPFTSPGWRMRAASPPISSSSRLLLLLRRDAYMPDFLNPPPAGPTAELEDELEVMLSIPAAQIRAEVTRCYEDKALPAALERFLSRPRTAVRDARRAASRLLGARTGRALAAHQVASRARHPVSLAAARRWRHQRAVRRPRSFDHLAARRRPADREAGMRRYDRSARRAGLAVASECVCMAEGGARHRTAVATDRRLPGPRRGQPGKPSDRPAGRAVEAARWRSSVGPVRSGPAALNHRPRPRARDLTRWRLPTPLRALFGGPRLPPPRPPHGPLPAFTQRRSAYARERPAGCVGRHGLASAAPGASSLATTTRLLCAS